MRRQLGFIGDARAPACRWASKHRSPEKSDGYAADRVVPAAIGYASRWNHLPAAVAAAPSAAAIRVTVAFTVPVQGKSGATTENSRASKCGKDGLMRHLTTTARKSLLFRAGGTNQRALAGGSPRRLNAPRVIGSPVVPRDVVSPCCGWLLSPRCSSFPGWSMPWFRPRPAVCAPALPAAAASIPARP
jgi:hypothetical protein